MQNIFIQKYIDSGWSFFNTKCREKKIYTKWDAYKNRKPTKAEINLWLALPIQNYALVAGEISNLVVIDVDPRNGGDPTPFQNQGLFEIRTPSGGYHFYILYNPLLESTKHKKKKEDGILMGVDIQSNGSLVFAPPTKFENGTYTITNDVPIGHLPNKLLAQILDALKPKIKAIDYTPYIPPQNYKGRRPGDIFNTLASWDEILLPLGWKKVYENSGGCAYWTRPGKKEGISANTNYKGYNLFFCFSKSVPELDERKGYTKFNVLTQLKYGGDYHAAAKALVMENYRIANRIQA